MKKIAVMFVMGLLLAGCATTGMQGGRSTVSGWELPENAQLVGGGFEVCYKPTVPGTAILVNMVDGQYFKSESLDAEDYFESTVDPSNLKDAGFTMEKVRLQLYFVPNQQLKGE